MMTTQTDTPRIYVASLSDYNAGRLHGVWIDADQDAEDIRAEIAEMLSESSEEIAEEYAIHDHENFAGVSIGEYDDLDQIADIARMISEHGEAYGAYVDHVGVDYASLQDFEDTYCGRWDSEVDYAENFIDQYHDLDQMMGSLSSYFDYERFARDLFRSDLYSVAASDGGIYVFQTD
jgi:antirestriction protein